MVQLIISVRDRWRSVPLTTDVTTKIYLYNSRIPRESPRRQTSGTTGTERTPFPTFLIWQDATPLRSNMAEMRSHTHRTESMLCPPVMPASVWSQVRFIHHLSVDQSNYTWNWNWLLLFSYSVNRRTWTRYLCLFIAVNVNIYHVYKPF